MKDFERVRGRARERERERESGDDDRVDAATCSSFSAPHVVVVDPTSVVLVDIFHRSADVNDVDDVDDDDDVDQNVAHKI